jgi:hypothetical protein
MATPSWVTAISAGALPGSSTSAHDPPEDSALGLISAVLGGTGSHSLAHPRTPSGAIFNQTCPNEVLNRMERIGITPHSYAQSPFNRRSLHCASLRSG